jgi:urea transport system permease protein
MSLGSILLLVALGLAITYGLMGVINMAHGELMMIGAYATYVVQGLFRATCPAPLTGICWPRAGGPGLGPGGRGAGARRAAFSTAARWRPAGHLGHLAGADAAVRTSLARRTWPWKPGLDERRHRVLPNLTLPYNRIAIIVFAFAVLAGVAC